MSQQQDWLTLREWYMRFAASEHPEGFTPLFTRVLGFKEGTVSGWFHPEKPSRPTEVMRRQIAAKLQARGHDLEKEGLGWLLADEARVDEWWKTRPQPSTVTILPATPVEEISLARLIQDITEIRQLIQLALKTAGLDLQLQHLQQQLSRGQLTVLPTERVARAAHLTFTLKEALQPLMESGAQDNRQHYRRAVSAQVMREVRQILHVLGGDEATFEDWQEIQGV